MIEEKIGRGTISTVADPEQLFEIEYRIHIEENDEPPVRPGVEVRSIKWVDIKAIGSEPKALATGRFVLAEHDGTQHLVQWDQGWAYIEPIRLRVPDTLS